MTAKDPFATVHEKPRDMSMGDIFLSLDGRINRQVWWLWGLLVGILGFVYSFIVGFIGAIIFFENDFMWATTWIIFLMPFWYVTFAIHIKRLQDTGRSWEWGSLAILSYIFSGISMYFPWGSYEEVMLINLSTIVAIPLWIICGFFEGTHGPNKFGSDPIQRQFMHPQASFDNAPGIYNSAPSSTVPVNTSKLRELSELRDGGIITEAEFQIEKDKILGNR